MNDDDLGRLSRDELGWVLTYERHLAHPPERVWKALTESDQLRHWLPCDIVGERRAGASISMPFWPEVVAKYAGETPTLDGEIVVFDPPSVFEWIWDTERLRFELEGDATGTTLHLTTWVGAAPAGEASTAAGYHVCLDHLAMLLETGSAPSVIDTDTGPLEARYRAMADSLG